MSSYPYRAVLYTGEIIEARTKRGLDDALYPIHVDEIKSVTIPRVIRLIRPRTSTVGTVGLYWRDPDVSYTRDQYARRLGRYHAGVTHTGGKPYVVKRARIIRYRSWLQCRQTAHVDTSRVWYCETCGVRVDVSQAVLFWTPTGRCHPQTGSVSCGGHGEDVIDHARVSFADCDQMYATPHYYR